MKSLDSLLRRSFKRGGNQTNNITGVLPQDVFQLERQRNHCHSIRDYAGAQQLDNRLQELKRSHEDRSMRELESQQAEEMAGSDASYEQAAEQLLETWQHRTQQLHEQLQDAEQQLLARQEEEFAALMAAQAAVQPRPKYSPALLNMRHIERSLAIQKEFVKADKVKQQADQLELLELSQLGAERAGKNEAEQSRLAAQHHKEREAAAKKAASALLAVQQRQEYDMEQLNRRYQAIKLSLSRTHAAQRLSLQQSLRGWLGLSKPSQLLGLPSFNSSLTQTRGLIPESVQPPTGFDASTSPITAKLASCQAGGSISLSNSPGSRCRSPPYELPSPVHPARRSVSPDSPLGGRRRQAAASQARAAAAGLGIGVMPPLTPHRTAAAAAAAAAAAQKVYGGAGLRRSASGGGSRNIISNSGAGAGLRLCTRGSPSMALPGARPSGCGARATKLPAAAGAINLQHSRPCTRRASDLRASWSPCSNSQLSSIKAEGCTGSSDSKNSSMRATTSHSNVRPPMFAASAPAVRSVSCASSAGSIGPWHGSTTSVPESKLQSAQTLAYAAAGPNGLANNAAIAAGPSGAANCSMQQLYGAGSGRQEVQQQKQGPQQNSKQEETAAEAAGDLPEMPYIEASLAAGGAVSAALKPELEAADGAAAPAAEQVKPATDMLAQVASADAGQQVAAADALCAQSEECLAAVAGSASLCELRAEVAAVGSGVESSIELGAGGDQQPGAEPVSALGDCKEQVASAALGETVDVTLAVDADASDAPTAGGAPVCAEEQSFGEGTG